jgi:hypothetical protein
MDVYVNACPTLIPATDCTPESKQRCSSGRWPVIDIGGSWRPSDGWCEVTSSPSNFSTFVDRQLGPDPDHPKPLLAGMARIYRGLGISALRSITTHGLLWTFFDMTSNYIDSLPGKPSAAKEDD